MCAYPKYRQMCHICIDVTYADAGHMHIQSIYICQAYGYVQAMLASRFFHSDPKNTSSGSAFRPPGRCRPMTQYVAAESAAYDAICCVTPPAP